MPQFGGKFEFPVIINKEISLPLDIVPIEKRKKVRKENMKTTYIHFYMQDKRFKKFLDKPKTYLKELKEYGGIISPDLSLYIDAPLSKNIANTYKNRECGYYLQKEGLYVIPNVRWADERSFEFCFDGFIPN